MNTQDSTDNQSCYFFHFGLIVTGEGEREHLQKLFKSLMELRICTFQVIRFIGQRSPIISSKRTIKMVGSGKSIPDKDASDIGLPARNYLSQNPCAYVVLVDDLEQDRTPIAQQVFHRYRKAFDTILGEEKYRASVHFLVNMLEAYYFAHPEAINAVLGTSVTDYPDDVETIRHPKNDLKQHYPNFDEIQDGGKILECLDIEKVLSSPHTCASLRTLFAWCSKILENSPMRDYLAELLANKYRLNDGILSVITGSQLNDL